MPRKFTQFDSIQFSKTLGQKLIPIADGIRDLHTRFGLRPYRVKIMKVRWSSGRRGQGTPVVMKEIEILPTPLVQDVSTLMEIVQPIGLDETGSIMLSEVSGIYTDDDLRFADNDGVGPGPDEEVYYEIEFKKADCKPGERRRFFLRSAPMYFPTKFQWSMRLERSHENRDRVGDYE